ncbi:MAG: DUF2332 family protein [Boseongicola sp. SB0677_bin_26]|nr:DUF2332 family protein [Boseongicola sp. SB0677_bin_26]
MILGQPDDLLRIALSRGTQTNEPGRCATLLPLLCLLPQPLALLEVGASVGLCLFRTGTAMPSTARFCEAAPSGRRSSCTARRRALCRYPMPFPAWHGAQDWTQIRLMSTTRNSSSGSSCWSGPPSTPGLRDCGSRWISSRRRSFIWKRETSMPTTWTDRAHGHPRTRHSSCSTRRSCPARWTRNGETPSPGGSATWPISGFRTSHRCCSANLAANWPASGQAATSCWP